MKVDVKVFDKSYSLEVDDDEEKTLKEAEEIIELEYQKKKDEGYAAKDCYCIAALLSSFEILKQRVQLERKYIEVEDDLYMIKAAASSEPDGFIKID